MIWVGRTPTEVRSALDPSSSRGAALCLPSPEQRPRPPTLPFRPLHILTTESTPAESKTRPGAAFSTRTSVSARTFSASAAALRFRPLISGESSTSRHLKEWRDEGCRWWWRVVQRSSRRDRSAAMFPERRDFLGIGMLEKE